MPNIINQANAETCVINLASEFRNEMDPEDERELESL